MTDLPLGKGEVVSSILTSSTMKSLSFRDFIRQSAHNYLANWLGNPCIDPRVRLEFVLTLHPCFDVGQVGQRR
jgi:hypothetical protein